MATDIQFEFRPVELASFLRYEEIMQACFGRRPDAAYYPWKYRENPAGELIAFEAIHEGRVAGFYGVIPWYFDVKGERQTFYQSMDTMTHPDYQRRGLFVRLANLTYEELARRMPDHVIVGIPGATSYPGFVQKLGWLSPFRFKYLFTWRYQFEAMNLLRGPRRLEIHALTESDGALQSYFGRREGCSDFITPALSAGFLKWRVFDNPNLQYTTLALHESGKMIGFAVYRRSEAGRAFVELIDYVSDHYWDGRYLPELIRHIFAETRAAFVFTWEPTRSRIAAAYRRAGLLQNPFGKGPFSYVVPFIVRSPHLTCHGLDLNQRASYDLQPLMQD